MANCFIPEPPLDESSKPYLKIKAALAEAESPALCLSAFFKMPQLAEKMLIHARALKRNYL
jgi:hypothetical protein